MSLRVDPEREHLPKTGVPVRAIHPITERWCNCDVAHLTRESLQEWLSGKPPEFAEDLAGIMLGHGHISRGGK